MKNRFKRILAISLCAVMLLSTCAFSASAGSAALKFNSDGKFTILNMSDIQDFYPMRPITKHYIKDTLAKVNPDLVVLTGDNIGGYSAKTKELAKAEIDEIMDIFKAADVKVAAVFGNHDDEDTTATKEFQMECYCAYDNFVGCAGEDLTGCGTYNLPILSSDGTKTAFNLWFTDSGTYNDENDLEGYGCPHKDQIEWYKKTAEALKAANGGTPVPAINFQHIVVPEIYDALDKDAEGNWVLPAGATGELDESPCPPKYSNGQFDAFLEEGDVIATVCGHDHVNTYVVNYKGIDIVNTPGIGFRSYNNDNVGSRVFVLDENNPKAYKTYCLAYNDIYAADDEVAQYRYLYSSDTVEWQDQVMYFFKFLGALLTSAFAK